jgi:hypothetical protein
MRTAKMAHHNTLRKTTNLAAVAAAFRSEGFPAATK